MRYSAFYPMKTFSKQPLKPLRALLFSLIFLVFAAEGRSADAREKRETAQGVVLLTLDTTRVDAIGVYSGKTPSKTPNLDTLASQGIRFLSAITPSPLTLPSHASLLTGLAPPEHGLHDNGLASLPSTLPTLASIFHQNGWATGAFISSRVLDRRFGLAKGFDTYDDHMAAEIVGEYGYAERTADEVTDGALGWLQTLPENQSFFLWVHFYDPHSPYRPPASFDGSDDKTRYEGEISFVDQQIGRLLAAIPSRPGGLVTVAVADHGEALGSHGERTHGLFLYDPVLRVPLIVSGPNVPRGKAVSGTVSTRRLAPTLLKLAGEKSSALPGQPLPGIFQDSPLPEASFAYSQTWLPATAYGWSTLEAITGDRFKLVLAPRPELYDLVEDPLESHNLVQERAAEARRLKSQLQTLRSTMVPVVAESLATDPEMQANLRSLGYLSGASGSRSGELDPKDGLVLLKSFEAAKVLLSRGRVAEAIHQLNNLVKQSPGNVPFLTNLGSALLAGGKTEESIVVLRQATELNPKMDFLHLRLAEALALLEQDIEASKEYELALKLNPRLVGAWLGLAELALRSGDPERELTTLRRGVAAGTESAALHMRLGQLLGGQDPPAAKNHLEQATTLMPDWPLAWLLRGQLALQRGENQEGQTALEQTRSLAPRSAEAREATRLLETLEP